MPPSPARKRAQARTTFQHSPRNPTTARPIALVPSSRRHLRPPSSPAEDTHPKDFKRRLHPSPSAPPTHLSPRTPPHPSLIAQATTLTAMAQPVIHRHRNPQARGKIASPPPLSARQRSPTLTVHIRPRHPVEAWTKPPARFPLQREAKTPRPPVAITAAAAPSVSVSQAIKPTVPST